MRRRWDIKSRHSQFQVWVGEVQFYETTYLGWIIVAVLFLSGSSYFGGGYWYNSRSGGIRGAAALPHRQFWMELIGLVEDGVNFSRETLHGRSNGDTHARFKGSTERSKLLGKDRKSSSSKHKSKKGSSSSSSPKKRDKTSEKSTFASDGNHSARSDYGATSMVASDADGSATTSEARMSGPADATAAGDGTYTPTPTRRCRISLLVEIQSTDKLRCDLLHLLTHDCVCTCLDPRLLA